MGFKQEIAQHLARLNDRVENLEALARTLRPERTAGNSRPAPHTPAGERVEAASTAAYSTVNRVDYGAVAFGLSEIKRKVSETTTASQHQVDEEYWGIVDYFADVFAKADPSFDRDEFNRQAGR